MARQTASAASVNALVARHGARRGGGNASRHVQKASSGGGMAAHRRARRRAGNQAAKQAVKTILRHAAHKHAHGHRAAARSLPFDLLPATPAGCIFFNIPLLLSRQPRRLCGAHIAP
jgi:hypothetical protein